MAADKKHISFIKYNNYANRTTHPGDTFADIMGTLDNTTKMYYHEIARIDNPTLWNPNDGVTTVITTPTNVDFSTEPDYLLVWHDENTTIESRWFVLETVRLQLGQYTCYLRRDVISEAWNEFTSATCNIDRAIAARYDSIIYNPEPVSVNQIIESEMEVKDKTGCPWIVFYSDTTIPTSGPEPDPGDYDMTTPLTKQGFIDKWAKTYLSSIYVGFKYKFAQSGGSVIPDTDPHVMGLGGQDYAAYPTPAYSSTLSGKGDYQPALTDPMHAYEIINFSPYVLDDLMVTYYNNNIWTNTHPLSEQIAGHADWFNFINLNGKRVYSEVDHKIYRINIPTGEPKLIKLYGSSSSAFTPVFEQVLDKLINGCTNMNPYIDKISSTDQRSVTFALSCDVETLDLIDIPDDPSITVNVPTMMKTVDSPYNIWCMPYGDITVSYNNVDYTTSADLNLRVMKGILDSMTTGSLYDAQILPYCPLPDSVFDQNGKITLAAGNKYTDLTTIKDAGSVCKGFIFSVPYATFERQILLDTPITVDDPKFLSMTKSWRLFAPNYGSQFEFSVARNEGLAGFNVSCTYMPIQPYIRVAPIWGGLYGDPSFKRDPRGLICGGDYSLPRTESAWVSYMENNKNYQDIFNRQIQSMDVNRGVDKNERNWSSLGNVAKTAGAGAAAGALVGSVVPGLGTAAGAVIGGLAGGIGSIFAGQKDWDNAATLYNENVSYATDMYNLQLGNVQAMPNTLARTTAFNVDNRYFPIFTTYICTDAELTAVAQFILNRSMTIGRVGTPSAYLSNTWYWNGGGHINQARGFIQGSIMHIDTTHDTHFVNALNYEFSRGFYTR